MEMATTTASRNDWLHSGSTSSGPMPTATAMVCPMRARRSCAPTPRRPTATVTAGVISTRCSTRATGYDPTIATADADFDGLGDALEQRLGSSPAKVESNGDGISDFQAFGAELSPVGPPLKGGLDELIGVTYSQAMAAALQRMRDGGRFPDVLAEELPYPIVTAALARHGSELSAALMQRALSNPHHSPGVYPPYIEIEQALFALAQQYDGSPGAHLRSFHWTGQTLDSCNQVNHPGRRIYAAKVSANPSVNEQEPEVAFFGVHHAREMITGVATMHLLCMLTDRYASDPQIRKLVDTREVWVIPVVNPNGYDRAAVDQLDWRKNTRWEKGQGQEMRHGHQPQLRLRPRDQFSTRTAHATAECG